jgi:multiple sugar transport system substrate-binding protein
VDTLKAYQTKSGKPLNHVNQPFDQINAKLNLAVRAGGDVPDLSYMDSQQIGFFIRNGTVQDLTDYVKSAPWYKDINPGALAACTAPDGKILCVPTSVATTLTYYWKDIYPNGFPATTDQLIAAAPALKAKGKFVITMKVSEKFALELTDFDLIKTFGGEIADKDGKAVWASPETAQAVQFMRDLFANKYVPDVDLAPQFEHEVPFKQGDAGALMAGSWSFVFLNPLIAPDGTKFDKRSNSLQAAYDAGKLDFAPPLAKEGSKPFSIILATAWAIPKGAVNVDQAKAFIDFQMTAAENAKFALAYGALPTVNSAVADQGFQTPYWQAVAKYLKEYAVPAPALTQYDKGATLLTDAIVKLITDPSKDIATVLKAAQDEYNAGLNSTASATESK